MNLASPALLPLLLLLGGLGRFGPRPGGASARKKDACEVRDGQVDCSRMSLKQIPSDLPRNISGLDVSHNRLVALPAAALAPYPRLLRLDASSNSVTKLDPGLCVALPLLRTLSLQHNEVHLLTETALESCANLTQLDLSHNRLKLRGEPFAALQSLTWLDVSWNDLTSARLLGTQTQLPSLVTLVLSGNLINVLKKEDFSFLSNSSSFRVLGLSFLPLKTVENGSFKPIAGLRDLVLDHSKLSIQTTARICEELSGTAVRNLSLQSTQTTQAPLTNTTLQGLNGTNLTMLDLSHNGMSKIGEGAFQWLHVLESLSLEQNNLKHLTRGTFTGLRRLRSLNLRKALVKTHASAYPIVDDFSFQPLEALESLCMANTAFRGITEHTFSGLAALTTLDLSWSSVDLKAVTDRTFASFRGSPLRTLNLTGTAITRLSAGAFSGLGNITALLLGWNFIDQELSGAEFEGLDSVKEIALYENRQKITLRPSSFAHVPTLQTLRLGRALSGTLDLHPSPFQPLVNLSVLDLSNNNIANINAALLDGLCRLKVLKLQHNNLARVWKSANPGGPVLFLHGTPGLVVLEIDFNGLDEIPAGGLRGLSHLRELSLSGNLLDRLREGVFDDLGALRVLRLDKNLVTSVRKAVFGPALANLSELNMEHNPFDCTCESILWFAEWLNATNASVPGLPSGAYICNTPSIYYNRSVLAFDPLSCKDATPFQALYVISSTAVLGLLAAAFLVHFHGWRIRFYWSVLVNRTLGLRDEGGSEEVRYEHDAYIIHAARDRPWVERRLLPLEDEDQFRFFLEDRDAVPGCSQLETIVDNMRKSRKIIFVVTETLLKDPWCRQFKAHQALHQVIEDSRDSVVLLFLQEVEDHHLSRSLLLRRGMLKPRCVLHWPPQRERIPAFTQKLRLALATSNRLH